MSPFTIIRSYKHSASGQAKKSTNSDNNSYTLFPPVVFWPKRTSSQKMAKLATIDALTHFNYLDNNFALLYGKEVYSMSEF